MKVVILGGGISGLSAAWYLLKKEPKAQITLFEKSHRLGGWIESKQENGFIFELGPRTFQRGKCPELLKLLNELELEPIYAANGPKFLWRKGKLCPISSFWKEILVASFQDLFAPRGVKDDESIYEFACRRVGKRAAELFFDPIAKGVYGGDIRKLSLRASFPSLFEAEKKERSLIKWMFKQKKKESGLFTIAGGFETLIQALQKLPIDIHLETTVEKIRLDGIVAKGNFFPADLIISALPGQEISRLVNIPLSLRNEPISVVNFGFEGDIFSKKGFGYLVPSLENEKILGQIWDTSIFPVPNQTKITSMVRGETPVEIALEALKRHLNIVSKPSSIVIKQAEIPQYEVGHLDRIETFEKAVLSQYQGKLKLVGNYLSGPSVESCLYRSFQIIFTN